MMKSDDCPAFKRAGAHKRTVAVDLDGTLFGMTGGKEIGKPLPGVAQRMLALKEKGFHIIIHTARMCDECQEIWGPQGTEILTALHLAGIPFDEIWNGRGKPIACHYVDDKAWTSVAELIEHVEWHERMDIVATGSKQ